MTSPFPSPPGQPVAGRAALSLTDELPELLSALAEAPDFQVASGFLLEQLVEAAGSGRGALLLVDRAEDRLRVAVATGFDVRDGFGTPVRLEDDGHPLVVSATGVEAIACDAGTTGRGGLPFTRWVSLPLPQPQYRGSTPMRLERRYSFDPRFGGCVVVASPTPERPRRFGHAPFGVIVLEGRPADPVIDRMVEATLLAGPILARMYTVDELRRSADRLDEQRSLLTAIINALPDPIVITDAANNIVVQNARAEHLLSPGEVDSEGRRRAVEINNLLFSSFLSKSVMQGGVQSSARELNLVDPDEGTDLLFEVLAHPLPPSITRDGSHLSVLRDVTDLKRASLELERQFNRVRLTEQDATRERDRLNMILNNVGDPILVTDDQAKIILMNPQAERLFEPPEGPEADRVSIQRVRANDTKFTTLISDFAISQASFRREQMTLSQPQSGADLPVEVVSGKILNERGEPMAIVSALHDLTKQVENERLFQELKKFSAELEDRIRVATADLEAQNVKLTWQASELEKAYRLKSEFLANMSHELRTPINALIGYTALMLDRIYGELTAKQEEGLLRVQASSQHLLALINDILDLAKIEAGKMPVHLEAATFENMIREIAAQVEPLVRKKQLEFTIEVADELPVMHTDRTKVKQIVLNLLSNAVKFTHRGAVRVRARPVGSTVEITVADTGIGIRREHLDVIFEEFRQVDQSRTREYGGTGLGLSITRKLVALLGGDISVESEYQAGTTFTVRLPLRSEPISADEQTARAAIGASEPPT